MAEKSALCYSMSSWEWDCSLHVCVLEVSSWGRSVSIPIVKLGSEILSPSELQEILLLFSEEPELCFKRLDLAAARDPSNLCTTGVTHQPNLCLLCDVHSDFCMFLSSVPGMAEVKKLKFCFWFGASQALKQQQDEYVLKMQVCQG